MDLVAPHYFIMQNILTTLARFDLRVCCLCVKNMQHMANWGAEGLYPIQFLHFVGQKEKSLILVLPGLAIL